MPTYDFEHVETGRRVEQFMRMGDAPPIGGDVEIEGERYRRVLVKFPGVQDGFRPHTNYQAPLWDPAARRHDQDGYVRHESVSDMEHYEAMQRDDPDRPVDFIRQ